MRTGDVQDQVWENNPDVIRTFLDMRPRFEKLAEEVAYILEKYVRASGIEYAAITYRTKELESFCEKIVRKNYTEPLKEITDIAGVRIVYLYLSDCSKLETLIENEFHVVEKIDKVSREGPEYFGYGALHYLVTLGKKSTGARYDDLKNLVCEIQIRTILQDGWAIVAHHLSYKQESDVPKQLRRKLNALSGLFETADDQFDRLREDRLVYSKEIKTQINKRKKEFLESEINLDNLIEFLNWKLPDRKSNDRESVAVLFKEITSLGYTKLDELDSAISRARNAFEAYEAKYPPFVLGTREETTFSQVGVVRVSLEIISDDFLERRPAPKIKKTRIAEFRHLVEE